jgi:glycyl-tRNA synthetase beta chain
MTDFLLELRSEEIPARMQAKAKEDLARLLGEALAKAGLAAEIIETFATPRRLALIAKGLPLETEAVSEETKGPKVGAPPQALEGFLRKVGLNKDQLVERDGVLFAIVNKPGRKTADVLAEAIPTIIRAFPWPKSQRWGAASISTESLRWVRPLQGIVALLGDDVVPCEIEGIESGRETMGHRFHSSGPVSIANAATYAETLRAAHVIVHFSERCAIIRDGAEAAAKAAGLVLVEDEGLVAENAGLNEWPVPMLGRFDPAFLEVPEEVIQLTARVNQKYFVCHDSAGKLANAFVCTANIVAKDGGAAIVAGNEKVLAARLSDAKFFWEQDLKIPLDEQAKKLSQITFHEKLGTVADKVERVAKLARWLVEEGKVSPLPPGEEGARSAQPSGKVRATGEHPHPSATASLPPSPDGRGNLADQAERAACLCKADLVTGMVGEFPELQGIMGGYYARVQGEADAVADAVRDHYKPVGQGDEVPTAPATVAVSLADKLDTLCQFFLIDEAPTGSKDPFALRRASLGIISLILNNSLRFYLQDLLLKAVEDDLDKFEVVWDNHLETKLAAFFVDRLKVQQREAGVRHDLIDAVFALRGEDDLVCLLAQVKALQGFIGTDEGANLLAGYKRAANILKSSPSLLGEGDCSPQASGGGASDGAITPPSAAGAPATPLSELGGNLSEADFALLAALDSAEPKAAAAIEAEQFEDAMAALASLRAPIDAFFDGVMVNDPDPEKRAYRLGLLARFRDAVHRVADFSRIEG